MMKVPGRGDGEDGEDGDDGYRLFRKVGEVTYIVEDDELQTPNNETGDTKISPDGDLLGERQFKAATFVIPNRHPNRKYMLAIDAARTSGFKDSLYYFRRNPLMWKLTLTQEEKDQLIENGKLSPHLKSRSVTLVTARSAYKLHGAKMIRDGRWIVDDYDEPRVLAQITAEGIKAGDPVGELPDPMATIASRVPAQVVHTTGGGAAIYRPGQPTTIFGGSGLHPYSKELLGSGTFMISRKAALSREGVDEENWMYEAARRCREADQRFKELRWKSLGVVKDGSIVGNLYSWMKEGEEQIDEGTEGQIPVELDQVEQGAPMPPDDAPRSRTSKKRRRLLDDGRVLGVYEAHSGLIHYPRDTQPTTARWESISSMPPEFASPELNPKGKDPTKMCGGTGVGVGAWGIAVVRTVLELGEEGAKKEKEMLEIVRLAEEEERKEQERLREFEPDEGRVIVTEVG